jgi:hypothetical protein
MVMSQLSLQVIIVVAFGAFCFGCGYLAAFIVTRNHWRDEMIKRGVARYNWNTGKWEWGEPPMRGTRPTWITQRPTVLQLVQAVASQGKKIPT